MEKFRKGRLPSDVELIVETGDGPVHVKIVDVNEYGMRLVGAMNVRRGEDITGTLKNWDISGVVRWARRPYCGIQFDSRAPEAALAEMRGINATISPQNPIRRANPDAPPPKPRRVKSRNAL